MREISFKFYDKKTGKFLEECGMWWNYIEYLSPDEVIVCQFMDAKDKNGKDIFEGDIVKADCGYGHPKPQAVEFEDFIYWKGEACISDNIEVIGNIYENPELLEA